MQNSPSTSNTPSTPIIFDIIEDNCTIIDVNNDLRLNEDQNKDLIEIENNNQPKIENEIENSTLNIHEPFPKTIKFEKEKFNLKDVLSKTAYGQTLLQISQYRQIFTTRCQSVLCHIIVAHLLNLNIR